MGGETLSDFYELNTARLRARADSLWGISLAEQMVEYLNYAYLGTPRSSL